MSLPLGASNEIARFIVRSKDRTKQTILPYNWLNAPVADSPHNFTILFKTPFSHEVPEFYVKVKSIHIPTLPQGELNAPQSVWGLDTKCCVDVCLSNPAFKSTTDTDAGQAEKTASDKTLALIPISQRNDVASLRNDDWVLMANNGNMAALQVKLFSDTGLYLGTRGNSVIQAQAPNLYWNCPGVSGYRQQLFLSGVIPPAGTMFRGDVFSNPLLGGVPEGGLAAFISGTISVLQVNITLGDLRDLNAKNGALDYAREFQISNATGVLIGFPYQNVNIPAQNIELFWNTQGTNGQRIIDDWEMELHISSARPTKDFVRPL